MGEPILRPSVDMLKSVNLLQSLNDQELNYLLQMGAVKKAEAHSNIVIEGELTGGLYVILDGIVGVYKNNQLTGTMYDIGQLRAGSAFGEMSLVDNNPRSATVRALTDCHLFFLSREAFQKFLSTSVDLRLRFYESCIRNIVQRLRQLDESYVISQYQLWKTALKKEAA